MRIRESATWCVDRSIPAAVAASALAVLVLVAGPELVDNRPTHRFLLWNLTLAWIPVVAALALEEIDQPRHAHRRRWAVGALTVIWALFLPNAPYLVSDLTHFNHGSATPWLDLARLVSFAWAGCLLAVVSMRAVHRVVLRRAGAFAAWLVVVVAAIASGYGVVLGRFARLNSWDAVTAPENVVRAIVRVTGSTRSLAVGMFFGLLVLTIYMALGSPSARLARR